MTAQDTEQFREFLRQLQREEHRPTALNEIKNLFTYKPAGEAITTIRDVGISKIVQCLNVPEKSHVDLTCEVLKICFDKFEPGEVIKNYTGHIMYLLRHEKSCVREMATDEVFKAVALDQNLLPIPLFIDVYVAVAQLVTDTDVGVANKAILITSNLPSEAYPKVLEEMKIALEYNASSKCNAYEVIVNISSKSYELCKLCNSHGYIDHMISELQSDDVSFHLNVLELLTRLAANPHGIGLMKWQGALTKITKLIVELEHNRLRKLLYPGYMKFVEPIAHRYPKEMLDKYPAWVDFIFEGFEDGKTRLPGTLDTLGLIGTTIEGKHYLASIIAEGHLGDPLSYTAHFIRMRNRHLIVGTTICAVNFFASLISVDKDPNARRSGPVDPRVTNKTKEWFMSLSSTPPSIETLFGICKDNYPEWRLAGLALLDAVCQHQWGEELVARTAGFVEYLLDRSTDSTKESKEAKYDIIKRLANSAAFDASIITRLNTHVEQGPFYSESALEVAMEEGD
ncbi:hypothetical protein ABMA28_001026 [Loxostege sticticalis]|uniref:26S proteasome non-ATPase regulatory subunit 5 n=1 Tax=Loxostege sticticalis TaxID=481309 RepID=A0ABD0T4C2_LOXSC